MVAPVHAVIVSAPTQGHVNPMMNLAELLAMRGFFITFVTTEWIDQQLLKASSKDAAARDREIQERGFKFRFLTVPDGLPPDHGRTTEVGELVGALQRLGPALQSLLTAADESQVVPSITCIISDSYLSCTAEVCRNLGVPRVIFWPTCLFHYSQKRSLSSTFCHVPCFLLCLSVSFISFLFLVSLDSAIYTLGFISLLLFLVRSSKMTKSVIAEEDLKSKEKVITCLPGKIPPIRPTDIVSFFREKYISEIIYEHALYESRFQSIADYVLVNTFEELEGGKEAQMGLSVDGCPALAIGPVFLPNFLEGRKSVYSMWEEDESCFQWLDAQAKQLHELALGKPVGTRFCGCLKSVELPDGFMDRTRDRALIVSWTNQLKVLSHPSLGGFLTHSGWNSTLEAISMGVPLIGWPYFGDHFFDCRFARDIWNFGLDFEGVDVDEFKLVTKEVVESTIRNLMEGSIGKELRENVVKLKKATRKAVLEGGTSHTNLSTFVEDMQKIANSNV